MNPLRNPNVQGLLVLGLVIAIGVVLLNQNTPSNTGQRFLAPAALSPTNSSEPAWRVALEQQLDYALTPLPTDTPTPRVEMPATIDTSQLGSTPEIFSVTQIRPNPLPTITPQPTNALTATIEIRGSTPIPSPTGVDPSIFDPEVVAQFQPPPEQVPLSLQPFDHFYFRRPVDASANSRSIFYYPYGSRYLGTTRIHHGVDMPNDIGERVLAGNDGTVVWAGSVDRETKEGDLELYPSYGNFVVIEHNFTIQGQKVWTLYAHMSAITVEEGQSVSMGDVVGLVGATGVVTGAHVHFEVRIGTNSYWETRNPLLWIVPYLNHGVIAGRVIDSEGIYIDEVSLQINRGGRLVDRTTTYAQPLGGRTRQHHVVPDNNWAENFTFGDVPAGDYQVVAVVNGRRFQQTVTVNAGMVNWVEFQVNPEPES